MVHAKIEKHPLSFYLRETLSKPIKGWRDLIVRREKVRDTKMLLNSREKARVANQTVDIVPKALLVNISSLFIPIFFLSFFYRLFTPCNGAENFLVVISNFFKFTIAFRILIWYLFLYFVKPFDWVPDTKLSSRWSWWFFWILTPTSKRVLMNFRNRCSTRCFSDSYELPTRGSLQVWGAFDSREPSTLKRLWVWRAFDFAEPSTCSAQDLVGPA